MDLPIRTVALIALGVVVVALMIAIFNNWSGEIIESFLSNVQVPEGVEGQP